MNYKKARMLMHSNEKARKLTLSNEKARKLTLSKKGQEAGIGIGKLVLLIIIILVLVVIILALTVWKAKITDFFENLPGFESEEEEKPGGIGVEIKGAGEFFLVNKNQVEIKKNMLK